MAYVDRPARKNGLGIAFGGGAVRGAAHIGVIKVFQEAGIKFDYVTGNSIGSMVAAMYCSGKSWRDMAVFAKNVRFRDIFGSRVIISKSPSTIEELIKGEIGDINFNELEIPLNIVTVDIKSGQAVTLDKGSVAKAVSASCCLPGIFAPVEWDGMMLVDGGLLNSMPADVCRDMGADFVVGVNLNKDRRNGTNSTRNVDVLISAINIMMSVNTDYGIEHSDVVIEPNLSGYRYFSLKNIDEMIILGEKAAKEVLPEIKAHFLKGK